MFLITIKLMFAPLGSKPGPIAFPYRQTCIGSVTNFPYFLFKCFLLTWSAIMAGETVNTLIFNLLLLQKAFSIK